MTASESTNEFYEVEVPEECNGLDFSTIQNGLHEYNLQQADKLPKKVGQKEGQERNTILLLGFYKKTDKRKENININPDPNVRLESGDHLLFLSYRCDERIKKIIRDWLSRVPELSPAALRDAS
jgi:hypothetical protein